MTTQNIAKSVLALTWKPSQGYDCVGQSDDGRCLLYRNASDGQDYSLCVDNNTAESWNALWQLKNASTAPASNYHATAKGYLADERAYGMGVLGLSEGASNDRAYGRLARLAKKSGVDPMAELNKDERIEYAAASMLNKIKGDEEGSIGGVAMGALSFDAKFVALVLGIYIVAPLAYSALKDLIKDKDTIVSACADHLRNVPPPPPQRQPEKNTFICKDGQKEELHTCDELSFSCKGTSLAALAGGMICVRCDTAEFVCESILPTVVGAH